MVERYKKIKVFLCSLLKEHISIVVFVAVLFVTAVIFGAIIVNSLGMTQKQNLYLYLTQFFSEITNNKSDIFVGYFAYAFIENLKTFLLIWILGISVIGVPLILLILFIRGTIIGFTVGFLVNQVGWKGFLFASVTVLPHNLIIVPLIILLTGAAVVISLKMIKRQFKKEDYEPLKQYFYFYFFLLIIGILLLALATSIEVYLSPMFMKWIIPLL